MSKNPRIMVFKLKELIYTGIFVLLGILLIILLICMFKSDKDSDDTVASPGQVNATVQENGVLQENPLTTNQTEPGNIQSTQITDAANATSVQSTDAANVTTAPATDSANAATTKATEAAESVAESQSAPQATKTSYVPGIYTSSLMLNNSSLEIEVCVNANHINAISIKNMDDAITTMYPLMANSMNDLSNQIINTQSLENITYTEDCRYTYMILLDAITTTLNKAKVQE